MEPTFRLYDLFKAGNMSARAEYYSGRGPNRGDCGADHLAKIHAFLKARDPEAAKAMVMTIFQLEEMGASEIIIALEQLHWNNYRMPEEILQPKQTEAVAEGFKNPETGNYDSQQVAGMCGLFNLLGDRSTPEERRIKGDGIKQEFFQKLNSGDLPDEVLKARIPSMYAWSPDHTCRCYYSDGSDRDW